MGLLHGGSDGWVNRPENERVADPNYGTGGGISHPGGMSPERWVALRIKIETERARYRENMIRFAVREDWQDTGRVDRDGNPVWRLHGTGPDQILVDISMENKGTFAPFDPFV